MTIEPSPQLRSRALRSLGRDAIYWHYPHYNRHPQSFPSGVIRAGPWKLIEAFETGELSLYNLADDIGESKDLSDQLPARVSPSPGPAARVSTPLKSTPSSWPAFDPVNDQVTPSPGPVSVSRALPPARLSNPLKAMPATLPVPGPLTVHCVAVAQPRGLDPD